MLVGPIGQRKKAGREEGGEERKRKGRKGGEGEGKGKRRERPQELRE